MYSRSKNELRKEAAMIGANPDFVRPYNLAGRYGCEYYVTHSEISHEVYMCDIYDHNFSNANISIKPRDLKIRENIFTRIKRRLTSSKDKNIGGEGGGGGGSSSGSGGKSKNEDGGDGTGGGKASDFLLSGNDPVSDVSSSPRSVHSLNDTKMERVDLNNVLPQNVHEGSSASGGGGGKFENEDGGDNSGGGRNLFNTYYGELETFAQNEADNIFGVSIKGGDMGGGGLKDNNL